MADTSSPSPREPLRLTAAAAVAAAELRQLANGRPGYYRGNYGISSGNSASFWTAGQATCVKPAGVVFLDGGPAYWDRSERKVTYKAVGDRDFPIGSFVGDAASADETCSVNFDILPSYLIDSRVDSFHSIPIGTHVAGGFGYPVRLGGSHLLTLDTQNQAQKIDLFSIAKFSLASNPIVEFAIRVLDNGTGATPLFHCGVAPATHATDIDAVSEIVLLQVTGNDTNNYLQSDDGTTEITATDTTTDYTEGYESSVQETWWMDFRDPADVQIYRNGVLQLPSTVFDVSDISSELRLIAHLVKTASTSPAQVAVDYLRVRTAEQ